MNKDSDYITQWIAKTVTSIKIVSIKSIFVKVDSLPLNLETNHTDLNGFHIKDNS